MQGSDTEVSEYVEDHWTVTKSLSVTLGARLSTQTIGLDAALAPRVGVAYSFPSWKTVIRAGAGLIYSHVPLLAQDFADNQTRVLNFPGTTLRSRCRMFIFPADPSRTLLVRKM